MPRVLDVDIWDEQQWLDSRQAYEDLHRRSEADRLFMSWDWQTLWWKHLAPRRKDDAIRTYVMYDGPNLVGAMPVICALTRGRWLQYQAVKIRGGCVRESRGVFSEYLDVVAIPGYANLVRAAGIRTSIERNSCRTFSIGNTSSLSDWSTQLNSRGSALTTYTRTIDRMHSYQADLSHGFMAYIHSLSGGARRSLFNLRCRLESRGAVRLETIDPNDTDTALDQLNELHQQRWSAPALQGAALRLHKDLVQSWRGSGRIQLSRLRVGDRTISMVYDIRMGDIQYNIQMGFDPSFDSKISLGLLHLGYSMELAAQQGVVQYDFLAGIGKKADYKKRLASSSCEVASIQHFTGPLLATLYRAYDGIKKLLP